MQIDTLKSIDGRLQNVEEKLSQDSFDTAEEAEDETQTHDETGQPPGTIQEKSQEQEGLTAVGRSGRIYTEAELESQIRE
ncbi:hypothetical protein SDC9_160881 [bioreactor metagenome]|uniref:Uncharacterized protein n=1 Tax=bioreactor metagenome TaxID=1076179 RepID=A0A645FHX0_9ZZZZ